MLATNGPQWFDRRRPENIGPSIVAGVVATVALFATAFVAMQTVGQWDSRSSSPIEPPVVVRLTPPLAPPLAPPPVARPRPQQAPVVQPQPAPNRATPTTPAVPATIVPPIAAPNVAAPARDTAGATVKAAPPIPLGPTSATRTGPDTAMAVGRSGIAPAPAGVTIGSRTPNTASFRDSVGRARMKGIPELAASRPPTGKELAALNESKAAALRMNQRTSTAGNPNVHVMQGEGMGGEGAVGGSPAMHGGGNLSLGGSVGLPLLSNGPSAAQRKKNVAVDSEYQLRLRRLEDRLLLKRDSLRLDSLRRDSLRRDSLARRRP